MSAGRTKSSHAAGDAMVRAELKRHNIKASVTSECFSGGNSVDVVILQDVMPATRDAIESFCAQFKYGHFDGMTDCYEYTSRRDDIPQVKYLHVRVEYSEAIKADAAAYVANIDGLEEYQRSDYRWMALNGSWGSFWSARKPRVAVAQVSP